MSRAATASALGLAVIATLMSGAAHPQAPPATDIHLLELDLGTSPLTVGAPRNVTDRDGYDNQPFFEPEGDGLLYTSSRGGQTDVYRLDLGSGQARRLTSTPESEYSPTVMPSGLEISLIRVEGDGRQRLWAFGRDGASPRLLLEAVEPVGYQAWADASRVAVFVLGEPATLQLANLQDGTATVLASDIGRSLQSVPGAGTVSFTQRIEGVWWIRELDPRDGTLRDIAPPLVDSQDTAWTPDGRLLMARGSSLYELATATGEWRQAADLAGTGITGITRLAVHPQGRWLALVAARPQASP